MDILVFVYVYTSICQIHTTIFVVGHHGVHLYRRSVPNIASNIVLLRFLSECCLVGRRQALFMSPGSVGNLISSERFKHLTPVILQQCGNSVWAGGSGGDRLRQPCRPPWPTTSLLMEAWLLPSPPDLSVKCASIAQTPTSPNTCASCSSCVFQFWCLCASMSAAG